MCLCVCLCLCVVCDLPCDGVWFAFVCVLCLCVSLNMCLCNWFVIHCVALSDVLVLCVFAFACDLCVGVWCVILFGVCLCDLFAMCCVMLCGVFVCVSVSCSA